MELYVFNEVDHMTVIDTYSSFRWTRKMFEPGEFELHVPNNYVNQNALYPQSVIWRVDDDEPAVVETLEMKEKEMIVTGRLFTRELERDVIPAFTFSGHADDAMVAALNAAGIYPIMQLPNVTDSVSIQARFHTPLDLCQRIARAYNLGFQLTNPRNGYSVFRVYSGQSRNYVFSDEYDNLYDPVYTNSQKNYYTSAVVAGEGEGDARKYVIIGSGPQIYVDARDLQKGNQTDAQYKAQLQQRGYDKLAELQPIDSFEFSVNPIDYKNKWDLGDLVKVQYNPWGRSREYRITAVDEIYENNSVQIVPTFGTPLPEKLTIGD